MGYDETRFPNPPGDEFKCPICCGVLQDPVECATCQSSFCQSCIDLWKEKSKQCPSRCELKLQPCHRQFKNIYLRLQIRCRFVEGGCQEVLTLEAVEKHEGKECVYREVTCRHDGCGLVAAKKVVEPHEGECQYAVLTCERCTFTFLRRDKDAHTCVEALITAISKVHEENKALEEVIGKLEEEAREGGEGEVLAKTNLQVHASVECSGCKMSPLCGKRFMCRRCVKFNLCEICRTSFPHVHDGFLEIASSESHEGVRCDGCGVRPVSGIRYKCKQCPDFDFCHECRLSRRHPHADFAVWQPFWVSVVPLPEEKRYYVPGERFTRAWMIVNLGSEEVANMLLNCMNGEPCCERTSFHVECRLKQNSTIILSVSEPVISLPAGDYASEWSLSTMERCSYFGPKLCYRLSVI